MDKRIGVPKGMLQAGHAAMGGFTSHTAVERCLKSSLQWLSENPIVPTEKQVIELWRRTDGNMRDEWPRAIVTAWQRIMFQERTSPIEDLVSKSYEGLGSMTIGEALDVWPERIRNVALEAYRRGKAGK